MHIVNTIRKMRWDIAVLSTKIRRIEGGIVCMGKSIYFYRHIMYLQERGVFIFYYNDEFEYNNDMRFERSYDNFRNRRRFRRLCNTHKVLSNDLRVLEGKCDYLYDQHFEEILQY